MYQSKKPYTKPAAAPVAAAAAPAAAPAAKQGGTRPTHTLNVRIGKEGELQKVTGLFSEQSKNGRNYLKVTIKEDLTFPAGTTLMIFENTPKE